MASSPPVSRPPTAVPPSEEELQFIFTAFDRDHDGFISLDELVDLLRACGLNPTKTEACKIMMEFDKNIYRSVADGMLDYNEARELILRQWKSSAERELIEAFRFFDTNKNGFIEKSELKTVLMNYGDDKLTSDEVEELVSRMMSEADVDTNRKVDYYEFSRAMTEKIDWIHMEQRTQSASSER